MAHSVIAELGIGILGKVRTQLVLNAHERYREDIRFHDDCEGRARHSLWQFFGAF